MMPYQVDLPLGWVVTGWVCERSLSVPSILTIFHLYSSHSPSLCSGIGICHTRKGCTLPCGKKGLKVERVKVAGKS
jgi:hypothetical protein